MTIRFYFLTLLVLSIGLVEARYHKRSENENCNKLADAVQAIFDSIPSYIKCFISKASESLLKFDVTERQTIERISCLLTDNAGSGVGLFNALDDAGFIDQLIEVTYTLVAAQAGAGIVQDFRKSAVRMDLNKCTLDNTTSRSYFSDHVETEDWLNLAKVIEDLQMFSLTPELTTTISTLMGSSGFGRPVGGVSNPCACSAITDPQQRCRMAKEATAPFIQAVMKDQRLMRDFILLNTYAQQFTGVSIFTDFPTDVAQIVCNSAKIQSLAGHRALLEDYGLLQVGFELAIGFGCTSIQNLRRKPQMVIDRYENTAGDAYWNNAEQDVAIARATIKLADIWLEVGLGSIRLDNVPPMPMSLIERRCRAPESATPNTYHQ